MTDLGLGLPPPIRILVADDEEQILDEYVRVLGGGAEADVNSTLADLEAELFGKANRPLHREAFALTLCRQASDAITAFEEALAASSPFAAAFLDVRMPPGPDGVVAAERIRRLDPHVNLVFVTGFSDVQVSEIAARVPPADKLLYCHKPLHPSELRQLASALSAKWLAERDLRATRVRLQQIMNSTPTVLYCRASTGQYALTFVSENVAEQFGHRPGSLLHQPNFWLEHIHADDRARVLADLSLATKMVQLTSEYRFRHGSGDYRWISDRMQLVEACDGEGAEIIGCWIDITARRLAEERIRSLAYYDTLTGLPNRAFMRELLEQALASARRRGNRLAVLFLDLDQFKQLNDTYGHDQGDMLLRAVAQRLGTCIRSSDRVFREPDVEETAVEAQRESISRLGGDEFVVILSEIGGADDAANVARRIIEGLAPPIPLASEEVTITVSIGISIYPDDATDAHILLKHADAAMYNAKDQGRNHYAFFHKGLDQRAAQRFSLACALRKALERDEFVLHFQPRVDIQRHRVVGMEALIRWRGPHGKLVSPAEFIPVAEETGLILPIGSWVLREACRQTALWTSKGFDGLTLSVNLSAVQFKQKNLVEEIIAVLDDGSLPPERLELELTESMLIEDTAASASILMQLKEIGVGISIDDFGAGYSSLSYLKRFTVNALKIDRFLIDDIARSSKDAAIVIGAISLAHNLRLKAVAEGVERQMQADFLIGHGCEEAQGFLFSPPLPADEFEQWLCAWPSVAEAGAVHSVVGTDHSR